MGILDGKVAIVTGAGKGLGVGEALALAKAGAAVMLLGRTHETLLETAREIDAIGGRSVAMTCDVTRRDQVERAVAAAIEHFGAIDILVNNAQSTFPKHPAEEWTDEEMRTTWESGPLGSWYCMVACFPHMKQNGGRIINFCSPAGHGRTTGYIGYSMAKEAVRALSRQAAREWGRYGITVNTISPAAMSAFVAQHFATEEIKQALYDELGFVIRELGDPEFDIGGCVVYLASPEARHITGCTLSVDCGCAMI